MPITASANYAAAFTGYFLQDCAVVSAHNLTFVLRNAEDTASHDSLEERLVRKKCVWQESREPDPLHGQACVFRGTEEFFTTAAQGEKGPLSLFVAADGLVFVHDASGARREDSIGDSAALPSQSLGIQSLKNIAGTPYVCGARGLVALREQAHVWRNISLPAAAQAPMLLDIDGFAPDDIYAVGMPCGIFHYNGMHWEALPFPSNIPLESLCCGADGCVYIGGKGGTVFAGRGNAWKLLHQQSLTLPFVDMVWHDHAVWCTNDYGLWTIRDQTLTQADVPAEVYLCSGHLCARDNVLLLGGMNGAALLQEDQTGPQWQVLYIQPEILLSML